MRNIPLVIILTSVAICATYGVLYGIKSTQARYATQKAEEVRSVAEKIIKKHLKCPGSAKFGYEDNKYGNVPGSNFIGDDFVIIRGWVDSQNGFGALCRNRFDISLNKNDNGEWESKYGPSFSDWIETEKP